MKRVLVELFSGGAGYVIMGLASAGLIWGYGHHKYNEGKTDCQEAQAKADGTVDDATDTLSDTLGTIEKEHTDETHKIKETYQAAISVSDLDEARRAGLRLGRELGRRAALDDVRSQGGCLVVDYEPDGVMLKRARSLQDEVFGRRDESHRTGAADGLSGRPEGQVVPGAESRGYPQPD